jgi:hypothetical protein
MAKSKEGDIYNQSQQKINQSETEYNSLYDKIGGRGDTTWDRATNDYNESRAGYSNYAQGGGLTDADRERMQNAINQIGSAGGGGGGGYSAPTLGSSAYRGLSSAFNNAYRPDYGEADTGFRKLAGASGGFDQAKLDQIYGNVDTLTGIGQTGGITQEDKDNILRKQMLDQEQTGGYSEQDKALVRAKSAASSPAYFSALKDNLERQRSSTGNLANAGAVDFKLARQSAQQQGQDRTAAEMGLQESIRGGKERAGQFLSGQGLELAGLRTANQLQGARSAGDLGLNTQMGITANQATGLRGLQESQTGLGQWGLGQASGLDQFGLQQAGGLDQMTMMQAQLEAQARASGAAGRSSASQNQAMANAQYQQWLTEYGNEQKQFGIGGLHDMYNTNLQASQNYSGMSLDALNSKYGTQGQLLGLQTQNRGTSGWERAGSLANAIGGGLGVATSWGGGGGGGGGSTGGSNWATGNTGVQGDVGDISWSSTPEGGGANWNGGGYNFGQQPAPGYPYQPHY